jgi:murein DD-endopeptidase MepM/ murein hydrolase activator NlpD
VIRVLAVLLLLALPAQAEVVLEGSLVQGGVAFGRATVGTQLSFEGRPVRLSPDGDFVIGVGRDTPASVALAITHPDGRSETRALPVTPRRFDIQRIDGLPERQVTPRPEDTARIRDDAAQIAGARTRDTAEALFRSGFVWPVIGPISGVYGSQRILNGQARAPHWGVDVAVPTGTPIVATADAVVSFLHQDMFFTGKTLLLDHGHGLASVYSHLSEFTVVAGERVKKGQVVGKVGATGRATGAHLHWGVTWFEVRLDPALLVPPMPKPGG